MQKRNRHPSLMKAQNDRKVRAVLDIVEKDDSPDHVTLIWIPIRKQS